MLSREITPNVYAVGAIDWDRRIFDELIPLPDGTSYNAYLIKGSQKTALIDTVDPTKESQLMENLSRLGVEKLDYLISNHAEQDHSGSIPAVLAAYPEARLVTNPKCQTMLTDLLAIPADKFQAINDGETLSLGDKTLEFIIFPWVHWPETMLTYLREDKILFPCDLFGSHLATSDLMVTDPARTYESAKRYYAEIMMPFRSNIKNQWSKLEGREIKYLGCSHGPVYDKPEFIMNAYREWISDEVKNEVLIPYVSMHGSVKAMVEYLTGALIRRGVKALPFNLTRTDLGELAIALVDAATIVVGSPMVLAGPHPQIAYGVSLVNALRPKLRYAGIIGSFGWGGKLTETIAGMLGNLKVELLEPVLAKGHPREADYQALEKLAENIYQKHQTLNQAKVAQTV